MIMHNKTKKLTKKMLSSIVGIVLAITAVFALWPAKAQKVYADNQEQFVLQNLLRGSGTVVLSKDYHVTNSLSDNGSVDIREEDNITLDLNGHKIYASRSDVFGLDIFGTLTITDSVGGGSLDFGSIDVKDGGTLNIDVRTYTIFGNAKRTISLNDIYLGDSGKLNISEYAIGTIGSVRDYIGDKSNANANVKIEGSMTIKNYWHAKGSTVLVSGGKIGSIGVYDNSATGKGSDFSIKTTGQQSTLNGANLPYNQTTNLGNYDPKSISNGVAYYGALYVPSTTPASINPGIAISSVENNDATSSEFDPTKGVTVELKPSINYDVWTTFPNNISVSWYRSLNNGTFEKIATTSEYYCENTVPLGSNIAKYFAIFASEKAGAVRYFESDRISVNITPASPTAVVVSYAGKSGDVSVAIGQNPKLEAKFSASANLNSNDVRAEYQWQELDNNNEWQNINSAVKATYYPGSSATTSKTLRVGVRFTNRGLYSAWSYSEGITYSVFDYDSPSINAPLLEVEQIVGSDAQIVANVANENYFDSVEYQWYYLNPNGIYLKLNASSWGGYTFSNVTTKTLSISRSTESSEPLVVRLQATGIKSGYKRVANSEDISVAFINLPLPSISKQPQGANLVKQNNSSHAIAVFASTKQGTLSYQWQSSEDNSNWENIEGATTFNYLVDRSVATNGTYYRCVVSNAAGSVNSEAACIVVKDGTVLNATINSGLTASFVDGNSEYTIDNDNRILTCHLGDTLLIGYEENEGNSTTSSKTLGTDWRNVTGLSENGLGKWYIDTSMAGIFEYYGRFYAEYDDGLGHIQTVLFDKNNDERMSYTVVVLPNEDNAEITSLTIELGEESSPIEADYSLIFSNGEVTTGAGTYFRGAHTASSYYHFISGYRLFIGIPNANDEVEYICVKETDFYGDGTEPYDNSQALTFDTSAVALAALGIESLDGVYDAYVIMDYQLIVNENVDGQFIVKRGSFEGHHFTIVVNPPCQHEHTTAVYTFDYSNPAEPTIYYTETCDICETAVDANFYRIYEETSSGLPIISSAATCTEDGMSEHKHFTLGGYDIYYVKNGSNQWVVCDDPNTLVIKAGHNYQAVVATDPTCTTDGNHAHYECSVCHKTFVKDGEEYYEVEPESLIIDAYHKSLEFVVEIPATCSNYGVNSYYYCSHCDKYFTDKEGLHEIDNLENWKVDAGRIAKLEHSWEWVVDTPATKTTTGLKHEECSACGETRNADTVIPVQECDHANKSLVNAIAATCTTAGKAAYYHCADCDKNYQDEDCQLLIENLETYGVIAALGHNWGEWTIVTAATETTDGVEQRVCANDPTHVENRAITASGYHYSTDNDGVKVFDNEITLGQASDLATLFEVAKAANGKVEVTANNLVITFNANAVSAIGGKAASLTANVQSENLNVEGAQLVIELSLGNTTFEGGSVHIKVPFTTAVPVGKVAKVYYINGNTKTDMNATFANGFVEFDTNHFSTFAVIFEDAQAQPTNPVEPEPSNNGLSTGAIIGIVIGAVAVVGGAACAVIFLGKKKKENFQNSDDK